MKMYKRKRQMVFIVLIPFNLLYIDMKCNMAHSVETIFLMKQSLIAHLASRHRTDGIVYIEKWKCLCQIEN